MEPQRYRVEPLSHEHLSGVVAVHRVSMPGYFMTNLGPRFLKMYYEEHILSPLGVGFVAIDQADGRVVGVVVGCTDGAAFDRWANRRQLAPKVLLAFGRLFRSGRLWGQAISRVRPLVRSLRVKVRRAGNGTEKGGLRRMRSGVRTIAVLPEARGTGVAAELMRAFEKAMVARGITRLGLSTRPDNLGAIRFYEKNGWQRFKETSEGVYFVRELREGP